MLHCGKFGLVLGILVAIALLVPFAMGQSGDISDDKCPDYCDVKLSTLFLKGYWNEKLRECVYKEKIPCKYGCDDSPISNLYEPRCKKFPDIPPENETVYDDTLWNMVKVLYDEEKNKVTMEIHGTYYQVGDNGTIWLQLLNDDNQPVNDALCYVDIIYPNKTVMTTDGIMMYMTGSDGIYYHDLLISNTTGIYILSAKCNFFHNVSYLMPTQDSYVANGTSHINTNYGNLHHFYVGEFGTGVEYHESYVQFDTTNLDTNNIKKSELFIYFDDYWWNIKDITVRRVVNSWDEGTITWNNKPNSAPYVYDEITPVIGWNALDITELVKGWTNGTYVNYGILISFDDAGTYRLNQFRSKEFYGDTVPKMITQYNVTDSITEIKGSVELNVKRYVSELNQSIHNMPESVWNYAERNLTHYPPTDYQQIADFVWNHTIRTLTDYNQSEILDYLLHINTTTWDTNYWVKQNNIILVNLSIGNVTVFATVNWTRLREEVWNKTSTEKLGHDMLSFADDEIVLVETRVFCVDNTTLMHQLNVTRCIMGNCWTDNTENPQTCDYGCFEDKCRPDPMWSNIILIFIIICIGISMYVINAVVK